MSEATSQQTALADVEYGAAYLGVKTQHFRSLIRENVLPRGVIVRLGRRIKVNPARLQEWIESGKSALPGGWRRNAE